MTEEKFDFYDPTVLKSYNLDSNMRYQLNMLDSLDVFTRKHSENVANITCRLCEYLHLRKSFTVYCTICAFLHDIGKTFIPPAILQKPGKLTDEEYETMKTHTMIGYKMCLDDAKLRPYAIGPRCHHEALNGSGYPDGLKGREIPLEAQIIKVADEYDAIVSKRQYKTHIGVTDTLKILIENAHEGKNNSRIVKALLKVVIDDTVYEIFCTQGYLDYLKEQLKRLSQIKDYYEKMNKSKSESKKSYYLEGMKMLFDTGETVENFQDIIAQYKEALTTRTEIIENLKKELKEIKKLRV